MLSSARLARRIAAPRILPRTATAVPARGYASGRGGEAGKGKAGRAAYLVVLGVMPVLTFCLGTWQVKRLGWKLDMIASLEDKLSREPARLPDHIDTQAIPEFAYRKVIVQGTFDHEHEIALGPRTRDGKLGVHVITPLKRADGQDTVLVNRGFVTRDKQAQHTRPESLVQGPVSVTGLLRSQEPRNAFTPDNAPEKGSWVFMDIAQVAQHTGAEPVLIDEVYHGNAGQMMQRIANGEPVGREATIELRNQHLTYAITWYSLSAATAFMFFRLARRPPTASVHEFRHVR